MTIQGGDDRERKDGGSRGRILFVVTSFSLRQAALTGSPLVDKFDFVLLMMDEMREACEVCTDTFSERPANSEPFRLFFICDT